MARVTAQLDRICSSWTALSSKSTLLMALPESQQAYHIGFKETTLKLFELRDAASCLGYLLPILESLPPTFSLLDVGCGAGSITLDLGRRFPQAKIIGVDQSKESIERCRASQAALGIETGVEFRQGDILRPEEFLSADEMGTFDVVEEHTSLVCIPDNVAVLRQMRQLARPGGGLVACRDGDIASQVLWPPCPGNAELQLAIYRLNGLDVETGRKLVSKALEAGFRRDQITPSASVMSNTSVDERHALGASLLDILTDPNSEYRRAAARLGYTNVDLEPIRRNMEAFMAAEDGMRLLICTEIICRMD